MIRLLPPIRGQYHSQFPTADRVGKRTPTQPGHPAQVSGTPTHTQSGCHAQVSGTPTRTQSGCHAQVFLGVFLVGFNRIHLDRFILRDKRSRQADHHRRFDFFIIVTRGCNFVESF